MDGSDELQEIVFLCHNSDDKAFIRAIADALELEFGTKFFLDVFAIPTGEQFIPWIEKALEGCAVCAIFLGKNGWGPTHLWEAELALARYRREPKLRIIPVALPGIDLEQAAKLGSGKLFQEVNWADFTKGPDDKESLDKLEAALSGRQTLGYRGPARLTPYQIRRDAERWKKARYEDPSILYGGQQLVEAERMARDNPDAMVLAETLPFLSASRERQSRRWKRLAFAAGTAVFLLATATIVAVMNYLTAEERRMASVSRQLAIAARDAAGANRVMLIAARAVLEDGTPEANGALLEQLQDFRFLRRIVHFGRYVEAIAQGRDGDFIVSSNSAIAALSIGDTSPRRMEGGLAASVTAIVESEDATWLGFEDGRVDVIAQGTRRTLLLASSVVPTGRDRRVLSLAHDASKKLLAVGTGAGRVALVRLPDGAVVHDDEEGAGVRINSLSFDPTRPRLAIGTSEGMIELLDTQTRQIDLRYPRIGGGVLALGYTEEGSLAVVGGEGRMFYFDRRNSELESPTTGDAVPLATAAAVDRATGRIAVGDSSGVIRLFDVVSGRGTGAEPLRGHSDTVTAIAFGKGRDDLVSASSNGTVAVWDLSGKQGPSEELPQSNPSPTMIRSDGTGALIGVAAGEGRVSRLNGQEWAPLLDLVTKTGEAGDQAVFFPKAKPNADGFVDIVASVPGVTLSDDASRIAWTTSGGAVLTAASAGLSGRPTVVMPPGNEAPQDIVLSGDGKMLGIIQSGGKRVSLLTIEPVSEKTSLTPPAPARSLALSRDGSVLLIGMTDGKLIQYPAAAGESPLGDPWHVHNSEVAGAAYTSDGRLIVSYGSGGGGSDRALSISNAFGPPDPRRLQARQAAGSVSALAVGAKGDIAVGDHDGQVLRWSISEARNGYAGRLTAGMSYVTAVLFDDARRRLVTASGDGKLLSWPLDHARWIALACAKANRDWRPEEWRELLPDDPFTASCSAAPHPPRTLRWWRSLHAFLSAVAPHDAGNLAENRAEATRD